MKLAENIRCMLSIAGSLDEALLIVNKGKKNGQVIFLAGGAGCYPVGTEFMTPTGWKNIEDWKSTDKVLQYNPENKTANFTNPIEYVVLPNSGMTRIKNTRVDFTTSLEHKHLCINDKTKQTETITTKELIENHNGLVRGNKRALVNTFNYSGAGIDFTDDELRLKVAIIADGHYMKRADETLNKCRMRFKKERKIERLRELLDLNDIECREYSEESNNETPYTVFEFKFDNNEKEFEDYWYNCNSHQLNILTDEVIKWDGSVSLREGRTEERFSFSSNSKKSVDLVQFAFNATGNRSVITEDNREGRNTTYCLGINKAHVNSGISKDPRENRRTTEFIEVAYDNDMYCFMVKSGFFIVRQNGRIYVSGNSGKGFSVEKFIDVNRYKIFDVDELKSGLIKLAKLKGINDELAKLDLTKPKDVSFLHMWVKKKGLDVAQIDNFLNQTKTGKLPNIVFDMTLKDKKSFNALATKLEDYGYDNKDFHLVWILADYEIAVENNLDPERGRVVPADILFATHTGAATTMAGIMAGNIPKELGGEAYVLLSEKGKARVKERTGKNADTSKKGMFNGKDKMVFDNIPYIKIKERGKAVKKEKEVQQIVFNWVKTRVPKEVRNLFHG